MPIATSTRVRDKRGLQVLYEAAALVFTIIAFVLAVLYAKELWNAPQLRDYDYERPDIIPEPKPSPFRSSLVAAYGLPPLAGVLLAIINLGLILAHRIAPLWHLCSATLLAVGWLITTVIWGHCHLDATVDPFNPWYNVCYQTTINLDSHTSLIMGVSQEPAYALIAMATLVLTTHFAGLVLVAYQFHLLRQNRQITHESRVD